MTPQETRVLTALSEKEGPASPSDLSQELSITEAGIRSYLSELKKKGYAEGSSQEWNITDSGRAFLEKELKAPVSKEDVGEDELSQFKYFGALSGVSSNLIDAAVALFQNTDMRSINEVERVMAEMNIP